MAEITRLNPRKARRLSETVYTDRGSRLAPAARIAEAKWFWPAMIIAPVVAFIVMLAW